MNVFSHDGDLGDCIASLPTALALGGGRYIICLRQEGRPGGMTRESLKGARYEALAPLLASQTYVHGVEWQDTPKKVSHDFSTFRHDPIHGENLAEWQARHFGVTISLDPWLTVTRYPDAFGRVVIAHSGRYRNMQFRWKEVLRKYPDALFVGLPNEHAAFCAEHRVKLEFRPTADLLDLARVVAGANRIFCNQSAPFWIAIGIGVPVVQETFIHSANSTIRRPNAVYTHDGAEMARMLAVL